MSKVDVRDFIESTILKELNKNNIFENYLTIDQIRDKLFSVVHEVEKRDLSKEECWGFWQSSRNYIAIEKNLLGKDYEHTAIHELIHALVQVINQDRTGVETYGNFRGINEGITEWLTQKLLPYIKQNYNFKSISFDIAGSYAMEQIMVEQLACLYGEDSIIGPYINNDQLPVEFMDIADVLDHINEKNSNIRYIRSGRNEKELSDEERKRIADDEKNIEETFISGQKIFLSELLKKEIMKISTIEEAEELKNKIKRLNSLHINIKGHPEANYEFYNNLFIQKYQQIVNRGKKPSEMIKFDDVEKDILENPNLPQDIKKSRGIFARIKERLAKKSKVKSQNTEFIPIDRGEEGTLYIRQYGEDLINGVRVENYQYLTEEQYQKYLTGNREYKGELLKGNIDFSRLRDPVYARVVGEKLLSQRGIEDKIDDTFIGNVFENQNKLLNNIVNSDETYFYPLEYEEEKNDSEWTISIKPSIDKNVYFYIDLTDELKLSKGKIIINDKDEFNYFDFYNYGIRYLGEFDDKIILKLKPDDFELYKDVKVFAYSLNIENYKNAINKLKENKFVVTGHKNGSLSGNVTLSKDQVLFTSIPYEKGWNIKVDGKKVKYTSYNNIFIVLEIPAGEHYIEMQYISPGFLLGVLISAFFLLLTVVLFHKNEL